jgi:hypothetical protein
MKPTQVILVGLILMLVSFIATRFAPSLDLSVRTIFMLYFGVGLWMVIIGALRQRRAKKKESDSL